MKDKKEYFTEDELVEKYQSGEFDWHDYVTHHSKEWDEEYAAFCKENDLKEGDSAALDFLGYKNAAMEKALEEGEL